MNRYFSPIVSLLLRLFNLGVSFLPSIVITRYYSPLEFGVFSFVLAVVGVCVSILSFGFSNHIVRSISGFDVSSFRGSFIEYIRFMLPILGGLVFVGIGWVTYSFVIVNDSIVNLTLVPSVFVLSLLLTFGLVLSAFHRAIGGGINSLIFDNLYRPISIVGLIFFFIVLDYEFNLNLFYLYYCIVIGIFILCYLWFLCSKLNISVSDFTIFLSKIKFPIDGLKSLAAIGFYTILISTAPSLQVIYIGSMADYLQVGAYKIALSFSSLVAIGVFAANMIWFPKFVALVKERNYKDLMIKYRFCSYFIFAVGFFVFAVQVVFLDSIFEYMYKDSFPGLFELFFWLSLLGLFNLVIGPVETLLLSLSFEKVMIVIFLSSMIFGFMLSFVLHAYQFMAVYNCMFLFVFCSTCLPRAILRFYTLERFLHFNRS